MDRINGWAEIHERLGDVDAGIRPTLYIPRRCARLIECRGPERSDIWFHSLYQLARTLNPMLSPDDARTVWERIERGPCSSRMAPDERQWIDFMKAVGNRAAPDMARLAEALLAKPSELPTDHRQCPMAAGMAGYLAQGKRAEAGAVEPLSKTPT
jgi:hypothetical protein